MHYGKRTATMARALPHETVGNAKKGQYLERQEVPDLNQLCSTTRNSFFTRAFGASMLADFFYLVMRLL